MEFEPILLSDRKVPADWSIKKFQDEVFFQEGPGIRNWQYVEEGGVRFVNIRCLENGKLVTEKMSRISKEEALGKYSHFLLDENDYVVSSSGTLGRIATVAKEDLPCCLNTSVIRMRPLSSTLDRGYLKYFLLSDFYQRQIHAFANGSAQLNYGPTHLKQMEIVVPPLEEQQAIGIILGTLDSKIELIRKTNETFEGIAKALFKSWFVDFDPVRAKADGRPTGLPDEISELFPDSFEESELGMIPSGWQVYALDEMLDSISDTFPVKSREKVVFLNTGDVLNGEFLTSEYSSTVGLPGQAKKSIQKGDFLFSEIRPGNGRHAFVHFDAHDYVVSTKLMVLRSKFSADSLFEYFLITLEKSIQILKIMADSRSGTFPQITFAELSSVRIPLPSDRRLIDEFVSNFLRPIHDKQVITKKQNEVLTELRDALLPRLISGELRVPDAEKMIEEVGI